MSETAETPPLTEERARDILRNSTALGGYLANHLDQRCSCNTCYVCAATFLVKLQDRLTGPTVFINGWKVGMNKPGVGKLLHQCGIPLAESFRVANQIVGGFRRDPEDDQRFDDGPVIRIQVAEGIGRDELIGKLRDLGVLIE